jgi:hypothetical protein
MKLRSNKKSFGKLAPTPLNTHRKNLKNKSKLMNLIIKRGFSIWAFFIGLCAIFTQIGQIHAADYYISALGLDSSDGLSPGSSWKTLNKANTITFQPGDSIFLRKGDTFLGSLDLKGSGVSGAPIRLSNYGAGALPIISAGSSTQAVRLFNQQYWEISEIETTGGTQYGIYVAGDLANTTLHHIAIHDVVVHDVRTTAPVLHYNSGGIVVTPVGDHLIFEDVKIDRVTVNNCNQWWGIHVGFNTWYGDGPGLPRSSNIRIANSIVHDIGGDPITVADSINVLLTSNVAYEGGQAGLPGANAIWTWNSKDVLVEFNEAYNQHTPSYDGGGFGLDWGAENMTVQYNYSHDNDGYGVGFFGRFSTTTMNNVFRYNICANNDRKAGGDNGEMWIFQDTGGSYNGLQIYNNTIYRNPTSAHPVVNYNGVTVRGTLPFIFKNNIIYSTGNLMTRLPSVFQSDNNIYWVTSVGTPTWTYNGITYTGFTNYVSATGQDMHSFFADPLLSSPIYHDVGMPTTQFRILSGSPAILKGAVILNPGTRDFFGNTLTAGSIVNIGADGGNFTQTLTSINVTPSSASVANGATQQFAATAKDQLGNLIIPQPPFAWTTTGGGTINSSGLFTASTIGGPFTVKAMSGTVSGTASITVSGSSNTAPTVSSSAAAVPKPVLGKTTNLSVLGADDGGEANLIYNWMSMGPALVTFSVNGNNSAKNSIVNFTKAGSYSLTATINDTAGLSVNSSVAVTVNQTLTTISVSPTNAVVETGASQTFVAASFDQFGNALSSSNTWSVSGGGTISSSGVFQAGATPGGPYTVTASSGGKSGTARVTVILPNLLQNPGFESGLAPWIKYGIVSVVTNNAHSGTHAATFGKNSGVFYTKSGLTPNTTYTLKGWGKVLTPGTAGNGSWIGVKNFGGIDKNFELSGTSYASGSLTFTTGANNTSAVIYGWSVTDSGVYVDDYSVTAP